MKTTAIPVLAVSTNSHLLEEARAEAVRFGANHYLVKPFDLRDLMTCIQETIGEA